MLDRNSYLAATRNAASIPDARAEPVYAPARHPWQLSSVHASNRIFGKRPVDRRSTRDLQLLWAKCLSKPSESVLQRGVPRDADFALSQFLLVVLNQ